MQKAFPTFQVKRDFVFHTKQWTFGVEHEFGDWNKRRGLPQGFIIDKKDITVMNSNGIAADPTSKTWVIGGEINTPSTCSPRGQIDMLRKIKSLHPDVVVNHRSNLHIHIHVPGLKANINALKILSYYNFNNLSNVLNLIEPIPKPTQKEYPKLEEYNGALRRYRRRLQSHHTVVTSNRVNKQLQANCVENFFKAECPLKDGKPLWHLAPRAAVNLRQLMDTDTIEFRHFPGTLDEQELLTCIEWCRDYLNAALNTGELAVLLFRRAYLKRTFPKFPKYEHWMEVRYRATCHDGTLSLEQIKENIQKILNGEYK